MRHLEPRGRRPDRWSDPANPAAALLAEMTHELYLYETPHRLDHPRLSPDELVPPRGSLSSDGAEKAVAGAVCAAFMTDQPRSRGCPTAFRRQGWRPCFS